MLRHHRARFADPAGRLVTRRSRRRLVLLSPSTEDGGVEVYLRTLARGAIERGYSVVVYLPDRPAIIEVREDLERLGADCRVLSIGLKAPRGLRQAALGFLGDFAKTAGALLRSGAGGAMIMLPHPDVSPGAVLATALLRRRSLAVAHLAPPDLAFSGARRLIYGLARRSGQVWVAVSRDNRRVLAAALGWDEGAVPVIYNGVRVPSDTDERARAAARARWRSALGLEDAARIVLSVARLNVQKGHDVMLDGIASVVARHRDAWWVWAGEGPERDVLARRAAEAGVSDRVRMLGHLSDVSELMLASDLLVFPSRYEGLGIAVLEAHMAELPVVASDAGPLPEIVRDGVDGLLVPVANADALAEATSWALSNPELMRRMAAAGRRRTAAEFSERGMVERTLGLLARDAPGPAAVRATGLEAA